MAAVQGRALNLVTLVAPGPITEHYTQGGTIVPSIKQIFLKKSSDYQERQVIKKPVRTMLWQGGEQGAERAQREHLPGQVREGLSEATASKTQ